MLPHNDTLNIYLHYLQEGHSQRSYLFLTSAVTHTSRSINSSLYMFLYILRWPSFLINLKCLLIM